MKFFISAIGTDSGKTLVSAMLAEAYGADYWKPIQAGYPTDSSQVEQLISNPQCKILPEKYVLNTPASPHAAAKIEGVNISLNSMKLPSSERLIVEGAGGLLVPINEEETMMDLIEYLKLPVILVANLYLGSINHTLLSCELLKKSAVNIVGIIFNGPENQESERIIEKMTGYPILFKIRPYEVVDQKLIKQLAKDYLKSQL